MAELGFVVKMASFHVDASVSSSFRLIPSNQEQQQQHWVEEILKMSLEQCQLLINLYPGIFDGIEYREPPSVAVRDHVRVDASSALGRALTGQDFDFSSDASKVGGLFSIDAKLTFFNMQEPFEFVACIGLKKPKLINNVLESHLAWTFILLLLSRNPEPRFVVRPQGPDESIQGLTMSRIYADINRIESLVCCRRTRLDPLFIYVCCTVCGRQCPDLLRFSRNGWILSGVEQARSGPPPETLAPVW